jgi:hypothetical protein
MWRARAILLGSLLLPLGLTTAAAAADDLVSVVLNQARILRLPEKTKTVVVGNPMIADVAMQKQGNLVLTGKSYGSTNLIALDDKGGILAESRIRVEPQQDSMVIVQRGMDRESYSCSPLCQPTLNPGDGKQYFEEAGAQTERRNALSAPK